MDDAVGINPGSEDAAKLHDPAKSKNASEASKINQPVPHVGRPLDGSQYLEVVEEQIYAEHPEQQKPGIPSVQNSQQGK